MPPVPIQDDPMAQRFSYLAEQMDAYGTDKGVAPDSALAASTFGGDVFGIQREGPGDQSKLLVPPMHSDSSRIRAEYPDSRSQDSHVLLSHGSHAHDDASAC